MINCSLPARTEYLIKAFSAKHDELFITFQFVSWAMFGGEYDDDLEYVFV